jgi:hypothetical protein
VSPEQASERGDAVPERKQDAQPTADEQIRALYDSAESSAAKAFEQAVSTPSFGALLARSAENVAALTRIGSDAADLVLRNLRVAGRADITRLAKQLHRTEDKLERVLQEVEQLRDELGRREPGSGSGNGRTTAAPRTRSSRSK